MLEWIGFLPLLGLTGNWRGYRMGGKAIGGSSMSTDMKKKFEAARASGNMDQAKDLADKAQKFNDDKKAEKAKAKEAKMAASEKSQEPVTGVSIAKGLGIKGVRENTKPEVVRKRIESHIAGENAARYLKAGVKSDLPQYKGVSESAARDFAQLVNNNKFSVNGNVSTFDGRGILIADKLVAGGILRPGNNKYIHELTPFGRELAKNVITDLSNGRVKKQADSLYAGN